MHYKAFCDQILDQIVHIQSKATFLTNFLLRKTTDPWHTIKDSPKSLSLSCALCSKDKEVMVLEDGLSFTNVSHESGEGDLMEGCRRDLE